MARDAIATHDNAQLQAQSGNEMATTDGPALSILRQYWPQLRCLLPSHVKPEAWYAAVYAALFKGVNRSNKDQLDLMTCANSNPESLMFALFDAARQGLDPGTEQYYLTPRPNKNAKGGREVLGIRGYQGEIELIYRAGAVASVVVDCVRRKDDYRYQRGVDQVPIHRFDPWARKETRGDLVGVYAYCVMKDGAISRVVELNQDDIDRARRSSPTANSDRSPWKTDEEAMWLKTGVHRLQKFVPTSAEYLAIQSRATAVAGTDVQPAAVESPRNHLAVSPLNQAALTTGASASPPPLDPAAFAQPLAPEDEDPAPSATKPPAPDAPAANAAQHRAMARLMGELVATDEHRHAVYSSIVGREVTSGSDLTVSDANVIIEALNGWQRAGDLESSIAALNPAVGSSLLGVLTANGVNRETGLALASHLTGREVADLSALAEREAQTVLARVTEMAARPEPMVELIVELIAQAEKE